MAAGPYENPLIRNVRMREMYTTMVEARVLSRQMRRQHTGFTAGLEACWVATAIDLHEGDLTSDAGIGPLLGYARDPERAKTLLDTLRGVLVAGGLAYVSTPIERVWCAIGAALALRANGTKSVVLAYLNESELTPVEWKRIVQSIVDVEAPVIFVVLPEKGATGDLARLASSCGVPGIAVDASDAVGIYRVAQESIVRARADGKPAVIACVPFSPSGSKKPEDPIALLGKQLIAKRVATPAWVATVEPKFRRRLDAASAKL